jgi:F-type H+-transporting ATPase subunit epsilon
MSDKVTIEIISPNGSIIKTEAKEVTIPSYEGEMGILKNHIPLITFLRPGIIKIIGDSEKIFFVEEGTVEFANNNLLILTSSAKQISDMNKNLLNNLIKESEEKIQKDEMSDKERYLLSYKIQTLKNINP